MKQVLQHLRTGKMELAEVPAASAGGNSVLIRSCASLIPVEQQVHVTLASFAAMTAARETRTINITEEHPEIRII